MRGLRRSGGGKIRRNAPWKVRSIALVCSAALALLHRSWRVEVTGLEQLEGLLARQERVMVVFWHGKYVPFFSILRGRGACVFASRSPRGEVIAALCRRFGHTCLTIPDRPGEGAMALMRKALEGRQLAAVVPDGPLGPSHRVKPGVIRLAADLGMVLLPASAAARPRLVLARRWDRMEIPLPFSRVRLVLGAPIAVPRDLGGCPVAGWEKRVGDGMEAAGEQAEAGIGKAKGT